MKRLLLVAILLEFFGTISSFGCDCGPPGPASRYVYGVDLAFVGKVIFTDDDGSGQYIQRTLVHFEVEESFKGMKPEIRDVWIDPGSCTDCYAEYRVGQRYLVFAHSKPSVLQDVDPKSIAAQCRSKPLPKGLDPDKPPKVYVAPECSGTREIVSKNEPAVNKEIAWLRIYRQVMQNAK